MPMPNQVKVNLSSINQSINQPKVHNQSLRLIDWFNPPSEKLPHGDDFRLGPKSDRTLRDNTVPTVFILHSRHVIATKTLLFSVFLSLRYRNECELLAAAEAD